jgi:hypothetical protein
MIVLSYILGLILITGLSLVSFIFFIIRTDPLLLTSLERVIFYLSFFLSLSGLLSIIGTATRRTRSQFYLSWKMIRPAFRQGIILSFTLTLLLILKAQDSLDWKAALLAFASGLLVEIFCIIKEKQNAKRT